MFEKDLNRQNDSLIKEFIAGSGSSKLARCRQELTSVLSMLADNSGWMPLSILSERGLSIPVDAVAVIKSESSFYESIDIRGNKYLKPIALSESVKVLPKYTLEAIRTILSLDRYAARSLGLPLNEERQIGPFGMKLFRTSLRIEE